MARMRLYSVEYHLPIQPSDAAPFGLQTARDSPVGLRAYRNPSAERRPSVEETGSLKTVVLKERKSRSHIEFYRPEYGLKPQGSQPHESTEWENRSAMGDSSEETTDLLPYAERRKCTNPHPAPGADGASSNTNQPPPPHLTAPEPSQLSPTMATNLDASQSTARWKAGSFVTKKTSHSESNSAENSPRGNAAALPESQKISMLNSLSTMGRAKSMTNVLQDQRDLVTSGEHLRA